MSVWNSRPRTGKEAPGWAVRLILIMSVSLLLLACRLMTVPPPEPTSSATAVAYVITATPLQPAPPRTDTPAASADSTSPSSVTLAALAVTPEPPPFETMEALLDIEEQLVINVYDRVGPAVVHITSKVIQYSYFWGPIPQEGTGSGFIIDPEGYIVTNNHVVADAEEVQVTLADRTVLPAEVVGTDPYHDLAVLKVNSPAAGLTSVELGASADLRVGQRAIAIGNPFGLDRTLTVGVISSLGRIIEREGELPLGEAIQTDAAINPGNSGGPLLNSRGEVIGVNTAITSPSGGSVGIGFAVPVDAVRRVVPELIEKGYYAHPWLGFEAYSIVPALARGLDLPLDKGLLLARVYRDGPAAKAGLQGADRRVQVGNYVILAGGDIVSAIKGTPVESMEDLVIYLETKTRVGDSLSLTISRDGREQQVGIIVGERPAE
jgi:S1-C subfamily serine protease